MTSAARGGRRPRPCPADLSNAGQGGAVDQLLLLAFGAGALVQLVDNVVERQAVAVPERPESGDDAAGPAVDEHVRAVLARLGQRKVETLGEVAVAAFAPLFGGGVHGTPLSLVVGE